MRVFLKSPRAGIFAIGMPAGRSRQLRFEFLHLDCAGCCYYVRQYPKKWEISINLKREGLGGRRSAIRAPGSDRHEFKGIGPPTSAPIGCDWKEPPAIVRRKARSWPITFFSSSLLP